MPKATSANSSRVNGPGPLQKAGKPPQWGLDLLRICVSIKHWLAKA
jgi:hypothetical protein